jgi:four helix bundle protein
MYIVVLDDFLETRFTDSVHKCAVPQCQSQSNIAEGKARYSQKEFVQFLYHARGFLLELETQVSIAHDLEYIDLPEFQRLSGETEEVGRILNGLINRFQS